MRNRSGLRPAADFTRVAQQFERAMVPAVFAPWAADLLEAVGLTPGLRVLDVACGTGIVARLAAPRVGPSGRVAGIDLNEAMIAVAQSQAQPDGARIEWRQGDACSLPYADGAFDVVLCQQGLQYMDDRGRALEEMRRVLVRGGRLGLSVFVQSIGYEMLERTIAHAVGAEAASAMQEPFRLADREELLSLFDLAGFVQVRIDTRTLTASFGSVEAFVGYQLKAQLAAAVGKLTDDSLGSLIEAFRHAFEPFTTDEGCAFPMEAHVVLATK